MISNLQERIDSLTKLFPSSLSNEERYERLMALGRKLPPFPAEWKDITHRIEGCQSLLYLHTLWDGEVLRFQVYSEALISAGLAALLLHVYSNASPQSILTVSPRFLEELKILGILSPSRSNGLAHIHARMKQEALQCLMLPISS